MAIISPYRQLRREIRAMIHPFVEVYVNCPFDVCEQREVKRLYARARRGEIKMFTGIDDLYEPPENPEVTVHTNRETLEESIQKIVDALVVHNYLKKIPLEEELPEAALELVKSRKLAGMSQAGPFSL